MTGDAWRDYVVAAQRLDAVRRGAAAACAEQDRALRSARDELAGVRARLAPQQARLRELGVPDDHLVPGPAEVAAAVHSVGQRPASVFAALRQARATADTADAVIAGEAAPSGTAGPPWLRNLIVYGPFAAVVFIVQAALLVLVDSSLSGYALLCGLTMPAVAFGLGWLTVGFVFPPERHGRVERTPVAGALACFGSVAVVCLGAGVLSLLR